MKNETPILSVQNLYQEIKHPHQPTFCAVKGVSFDVYTGETFALVGDSGSGKSTIAKSIMRIYQPTKGIIRYKGENISHHLSQQSKTRLKNHMRMIFQDSNNAFNPKRKVFDLILQGNRTLSQDDKNRSVLAALEQVGLGPEIAQRYPHQLSGGQRQRLGIARALISKPDFVIADEILSALDASVQMQILNLLKQIQKETDLSYLIISHNLPIIRHIADRVGVLYGGHLVEIGTTDEIFKTPLHPYTKLLLSAAQETTKATAIKHPLSSCSLAHNKMTYVTTTHAVLTEEL